MSETIPSRALVVGLGLSGIAACALLCRQGYTVVANDAASKDRLVERLAELPEGVTVQAGGHPTEVIDGVSLVVVSPGVSWELPLLAEARRRGIQVIAEVELAASALGETPIVGVTGSNGKSTTTALIGEMLRATGGAVGVGGNIGLAASQLALEGSWDLVVLELSSFQLEGCESLRPHVGLLLNVSEDHLDRHASMAEYTTLKSRLFAFQRADDFAVLNADDPSLAALSPPSRVVLFSLADRRAEAHIEGEHLILDGRPLLPRDELRLLGDHNAANALAAALAAARMGVPREAIASTLARFSGLPHRHQVVAEARGVRYVDDSKGTNVGATAAGLASYPATSVHLILGGRGKGQNFHALRNVVAEKAKKVYLIGEAAAEIAGALVGAAEMESCGTLEVAILRARAAALTGELVLLSPACASFDQFRDYSHRGEEFARLALETA